MHIQFLKNVTFHPHFVHLHYSGFTIILSLQNVNIFGHSGIKRMGV